jgi:protein Mpv17
MFFGGMFVAPTLYCWIKASSSMWPRSDLYSAVSKAMVEQLSYTPAAMTCFYFGMSLLEGKTFKESATEVQHKFIPTYRVSLVSRFS